MLSAASDVPRGGLLLRPHIERVNLDWLLSACDRARGDIPEQKKGNACFFFYPASKQQTVLQLAIRWADATLVGVSDQASREAQASTTMSSGEYRSLIIALALAATDAIFVKRTLTDLVYVGL